MIYKTLNFVTFAHGDFVAFAAYIALFANTSGMHLAYTLLVAILATIALGVFMGHVVWLPMRWKMHLGRRLSLSRSRRNRKSLQQDSRQDYYPDVAVTEYRSPPDRVGVCCQFRCDGDGAAFKARRNLRRREMNRIRRYGTPSYDTV